MTWLRGCLVGSEELPSDHDQEGTSPGGPAGCVFDEETQQWKLNPAYISSILGMSVVAVHCSSAVVVMLHGVECMVCVYVCSDEAEDDGQAGGPYLQREGEAGGLAGNISESNTYAAVVMLHCIMCMLYYCR
jgi:hypothetical protein